MTRLEKILAHVDLRAGRGVEIGPLMTPIVSRDMGQIVYVDRATKEELVRWYAGHSDVDPARIVDVDHIWGDLTLKASVGGTTFDFCVASHVVEHVPDLVTWFREVNEILVDGGTLTAVLPDKRYSFDCLRPLSTVADVVDAYVEKRRRPSSRQIFDHFGGIVDHADAAALWRRGPEELHLRPKGGDRNLLRICEDAREHGTYIDSHCWVFTPRSFVDLLVAIAKLHLIDFEVASFFPTAEGEIEFFVSLRKLPASLSAEEKAERLQASVKGIVEPALASSGDRDGGGASANEDMTALQERLAAAEAELSVLKASKSWRLTAPLRKAARLARYWFQKRAPVRGRA